MELYRDNEVFEGVSTFLGFVEGTLQAPPAPRAKFLEIVGDSISGGYGNLGVELHPNWVANPACGYSAVNSSYYATYGAIAGRALDVQVSTVSRSGWGITHGYGGAVGATLQSIYNFTLGPNENTTWSFKPQPDAVLINLGTNDW